MSDSYSAILFVHGEFDLVWNYSIRGGVMMMKPTPAPVPFLDPSKYSFHVDGSRFVP